MLLACHTADDPSSTRFVGELLLNSPKYDHRLGLHLVDFKALPKVQDLALSLQLIKLRLCKSRRNGCEFAEKRGVEPL